jgi:hypothetical protein
MNTIPHPLLIGTTIVGPANNVRTTSTSLDIEHQSVLNIADNTFRLQEM